MSTPDEVHPAAPIGLREVRDEDLTDVLEEMLVPRLAVLLRQREEGHCARVTDVDIPLSVRIVRALRSTLGQSAQLYVLGAPPDVPDDVAVSSTKLVELRNPKTGQDTGTWLRPPLLVFVPPGTHASAEDSFGVATFEQIDLGDVYSDLAERLRSALPTELRDGVSQVLSVLDEEGRHRVGEAATASKDRARFLLTVERNDHDLEAAGAALFEVGLLPDFTVFEDPQRMRGRLVKNLQAMERLTDPQRTERQRILGLGLNDPAFRERLLKAVDATGLEDPRPLARSIAVDRANWPLAFQHWPLREHAETETLRISVHDLPLPMAGSQPEHASDPVLGNIAGQYYLPLGPGGMAGFKVTFEVSPDPRRVSELQRFAVRLIAEGEGPVGVTTYAKVTRGSVLRASFSKLNKAGLEAGWHYLRVEPLDAEGVPLPVERVTGDRQQPNESDRFFVLPTGDIDDVPEQRFRKDLGVGPALIGMWLQTLGDQRDPADVRLRSVVPKSFTGVGQYSLLASLGGHGAVEIPLSPTLADHQRALLAAPHQLAEGKVTITGDGVGPVDFQDLSQIAAGGGDPLDRFLEARRDVFAGISGGRFSERLNTPGVTVEGADLLTLREAAAEYAEAYGTLLRDRLHSVERASPDRLPEVLGSLSELLRLDALTVNYQSHQGTSGEAVLICPTHPLRLLWLVTWTELARQWLCSPASREYGKDTLAAVGHTLREVLTPLGFPRRSHAPTDASPLRPLISPPSGCVPAG